VRRQSEASTPLWIMDLEFLMTDPKRREGRRTPNY